MQTKKSDYEKLRDRIAKLDLAIPGTIRETYLLCGKSGCVCADNDAARHGPYYLWNRKVDGKLTSKSIPKDKLKLFEGWINNRRRLEEIVQEILEIGSKLAIIRSQQDAPVKPKRLTPSKRGT
jgi:hypothetical protein